jgi:hypothetical protein
MNDELKGVWKKVVSVPCQDLPGCTEENQENSIASLWVQIQTHDDPNAKQGC